MMENTGKQIVNSIQIRAQSHFQNHLFCETNRTFIDYTGQWALLLCNWVAQFQTACSQKTTTPTTRL